jgi:uncharacterized membrane protein YccC
MRDAEREKPARSNLQMFLGFLLGVVASLGSLFLSISLVATLGPHGRWLYPLCVAIVLIGAGLVALRHARESSYAAGAVIAFSLALLMDAAWAIAFFR